jgi:hypothetical protein
MKKPLGRAKLQSRNQDNLKRRLEKTVDLERIEKLRTIVTYGGSSKHKKHPHLFGLEPFHGDRGDSTLCDSHAGFQPSDMAKIPDLIDRGLKAGLLGENSLLWTVGDDGWIFEGRLTNPSRADYHGYPVRPNERAIAARVYDRFRSWVSSKGDEVDKQAAINCAALYGFK